MKADSDSTVAIGWQVERFAREGKKMTDLSHYLDPKPLGQRKGDQAVRRLFQKLESRGDADGVQ